MEEMQSGEDGEITKARVRSIQSFRMMAWFRPPTEEFGIGSVVQILAAEAVVAAEGSTGLHNISDGARDRLLRIGTGKEAIGEEDWVWEVVRPTMRARHESSGDIATFGAMRSFDENRTIGDLCKVELASPMRRSFQLKALRAKAVEEALRTIPGDRVKAEDMADNLVTAVHASLGPDVETVRELLFRSLAMQESDPHEITDGRVLADLTRLGKLRQQLKVVASQTGHTFAELKMIPEKALPSRAIENALANHGQKRQKRPISDVIDGHLATFAAYCDELYVGKRTAEDFRRVARMEPMLAEPFGKIGTSASYHQLMGVES